MNKLFKVRVLICLFIVLINTLHLNLEANPGFAFEAWSYKKGQLSFKYEKQDDRDVAEWEASAIAKDIIDLNLVSLPVEYHQDKLNLHSYPLLDLVGARYSGFLNKKNHLNYYPLKRSWTYLGYDPVSLKESVDYEIKVYPHLRHFPDSSIKYKYEQSSTKRFFKLAKVSYRIANKIFPDLYPLENIDDASLEAKDFWYRVFQSDSPIIIAEGHKKALSILSQGLIAIGIRGVGRAFISNKDASGSYSYDINPFLKAILAKKKRDIFISFDTDKDELLNYTINSYAFNLARMIEKQKLAKTVRIIDIPQNTAKGADDYIFKFGANAYKELIADSKDKETYQVLHKVDTLEDLFQKYPKKHSVNFGRSYGGGCFEDYIASGNRKLDEFTMGSFGKGVKTYVYKQAPLDDVKEWQQSAISEDLIRLNLISLPDLVFDDDGELLSYPFFDLMQVAFKTDINERRSFWTYGGYKIDGVTEVDSHEIKVKPKALWFNGKYEHSGDEAKITLAKINYGLAKKIFPGKYKDIPDRKNGFEAKDFWLNVFASDRPIVLTEGHKKALSLLSIGVIAVSIHQPCLSLKVESRDGNLELSITNDLEKLLSYGKREFFISFDNDKKEVIRDLVFSSVGFIAENIKQLKQEVKIILLPEDGPKGADDFIYQYGKKAYIKLMQNALSLEEYKESFSLDINKHFSEFKKGGRSASWCFKPCYRSCFEEKFKSDLF